MLEHFGVFWGVFENIAEFLRVGGEFWSLERLSETFTEFWNAWESLGSLGEFGRALEFGRLLERFAEFGLVLESLGEFWSVGETFRAHGRVLEYLGEFKKGQLGSRRGPRVSGPGVLDEAPRVPGSTLLACPYSLTFTLLCEM